MLQPKRTKYRKQMKSRNRGLAQRGSTVAFGESGLKAVGRGFSVPLSSFQFHLSDSEPPRISFDPAVLSTSLDRAPSDR